MDEKEHNYNLTFKKCKSSIGWSISTTGANLTTVQLVVN